MVSKVNMAKDKSANLSIRHLSLSKCTNDMYRPLCTAIPCSLFFDHLTDFESISPFPPVCFGRYKHQSSQLNHSFPPSNQLTMSSSTALFFTTLSRGKPLLGHTGDVFRSKKSTTKVKYWACLSCGFTASVHTNANDEFIKANGGHRHMPAPEQVAIRDLKKKVKERVLS